MAAPINWGVMIWLPSTKSSDSKPSKTRSRYFQRYVKMARMAMNGNPPLVWADGLDDISVGWEIRQASI
jgi:hypothetical protein